MSRLQKQELELEHEHESFWSVGGLGLPIRLGFATRAFHSIR
jgi:hypothetical protein